MNNDPIAAEFRALEEAVTDIHHHLEPYFSRGLPERHEIECREIIRECVRRYRLNLLKYLREAAGNDNFDELIH